MNGDERVELFVEDARRYAELGWTTVSVDGKEARGRDWPKPRPTAPDFAAGLWSRLGKQWNIGVVLGPSGLVVLDVDVDSDSDGAALELLALQELPGTPIVRTGSGKLHIYFADPGGLHKKAKDGFELRVGPHICVLPPSEHPETGRRYAWERAPWEVALAPLPGRLVEFFSARQRQKAQPLPNAIVKGNRHPELFSLAGTMRARGLTAEEILPALRKVNERCEPPKNEVELRTIAEEVESRYPPAPNDPEREQLEQEADRLMAAWSTDSHTDSLTREREKSEKSTPYLAFLSSRRTFATPELDPTALHGPAGGYALAVRPYTEASPAAVLTCALAAFGNLVNRTPRIEIGGTVHYANEFVLLVGPTSLGRKGEAMGIAKRPFLLVDGDWASVAISRGFGSGEAVVDAVRDPRTEIDGEGNEVVVDPGAKDKRLLINEEEFGHVLAVAGRDGSTLSALIRSAWDGHRLENRTKRSTLLATNAHVSLLAGITPTELVTKTTELEAANGLLNRFLIVASRRQELLPSPPAIPLEFDAEWANAFTGPLRFVRQQASILPTLVRDAEAHALWEAAYATELSVERFGLAGAVCARAEAHTLRLSMLYALLDESTVIRRDHLEAALALWRYCESSARLVFGDRLGDQVADSIIDALRWNPEGMTRNEIGRLFSGHRRKDELDQALELLLTAGLIAIETDTTGGRPVTRVRHTQKGGE
jgi:hypothetical protein